jgi:hypothetical protein
MPAATTATGAGGQPLEQALGARLVPRTREQLLGHRVRQRVAFANAAQRDQVMHDAGLIGVGHASLV